MPEQGFLTSLFDVEFKSLITTKVIKVLYILSMILIGLGALAFVVAAFANSVAGGLIVLIIVAPLVSLLYLIYVRVLLEIVIAVFRIMETNTELVALQRAGGGGGPAPAPAPPTSPPPPPAPPTTPQPPTMQPPQPPPESPPPPPAA
jgi:outer membrane biosynthesis protein TonB